MSAHSPEGFFSAVHAPQRSPAPTALPEVTTTAMERFSCLADRCDDTCCRDWAVPIDRADLDRMKGTMATTAEGRERLLRLVVIGNPAGTSGDLGRLQMDDQCACPMLETDNRCGVHAAFGEDALTTSCAVFPRTALATPTALEVGGSLGCPEVARLTLLPAQADLRLRPASRTMLPRPYVGKTVGGDPDDAYARYFGDVREGLVECFRRDHLPLGTQLVLAADYAERAHAFLYRGTSEFQGARRAFAEHRLYAEIAHTGSPQLQAALHRDLAALTASGQPVMSFVWSLLSDRRRLPHAPRFATLLQQVFTSLRNEAGDPPSPSPSPSPSDDGAVVPETETSDGGLWPVYATRRIAFAARWGRRFDSLFSRYCQHYLLRNPYTDAATLLDHVYNLGIHLAAVRMLTVGHPELAARLGADPEPDADARLLDRVVVHVVQTFTKAVSHHPSFLNAAGLGSEKSPTPMTFGRLVLLAKFV